MLFKVTNYVEIALSFLLAMMAVLSVIRMSTFLNGKEKI